MSVPLPSTTMGIETKSAPQTMQKAGKLSLVFLLLVIMTSLVVADYFTSSVRMAELAQHEETLLHALRSYAKSHLQFAEERLAKSQTVSEDYRDVALHPNGAYLMIKTFITKWKTILLHNQEFTQLHAISNSETPSYDDLRGALSAILRLHKLYSLRVSDMYAGNYSGYLGPPLSSEDAYYIGKQAFGVGMLNESLVWLEHAEKELMRDIAARDSSSADNLMTQEETETKAHVASVSMEYKLAAIQCLLGRAYFYGGQVEKAKQKYKESLPHASTHGDVLTLGQELAAEDVDNPFNHNDTAVDVAVRSLCSRDRKQTVERIQPYHRCRYKGSQTVPYLSYKEEIISLAPYVSLFYDIISDAEINTMTDHVKNKMARAGVEIMDEEIKLPFTTSVNRISDVGWIYDHDLAVADRLSGRVQDITGLTATHGLDKDAPWSGEPFQLVNYGPGGHYDTHLDPLKNNPGGQLKQSGERLATFLVYLSDVDIGGHTVFPEAGISVAPVKGMALFWYSFSPAVELETSTLHAGCPVLKGHKWIANKWMWTNGNAFRRPCGPSPNSTHLDVEALVRS